MQAADLHVTGRSPDSLYPRGRLLDRLHTLHSIWLTKVGGSISTNYTIGVTQTALSDIGRAGITQNGLRIGITIWRPQIVCDSPSINTFPISSKGGHVVCGNTNDIQLVFDQQQSQGDQFRTWVLYTKFWLKGLVNIDYWGTEGLTDYRPHSNGYWIDITMTRAQKRQSWQTKRIK